MKKFMRLASRLIKFAAALAAAICIAVPAFAQDAKIGVVVMHGKGGRPDRFVSELADALLREGFQVANLEMPWSGARQYDVSVGAANEEINAALRAMREKGATRLFLAGHSLGAAAALQYAGRFSIDGVAAIAPGHVPEGKVLAARFADSVREAKQLVTDGKGNEKTRFTDFETHRGSYPVIAPPASYLTYFDPQGPMNLERNVRSVKPDVPVLYVVPTRESEGLRNYVMKLHPTLPRNAMSRLYEPASDHLRAPSASAGEIVKWIREIAATGK
jgi:pimeloyl-ACP methyl ester carboxylesterase